MTGKPTTSTSKPATTKTSKSKLSKDQQFDEMGRVVEKIEKVVNPVSPHTLRTLGDLVTSELGALSPREARVLKIALGEGPSLVADFALQMIRHWVAIDQTIPIPAKHIGRALNDLGAIDDDHAKSRVEIFAFFHTGLAQAVLPFPKTGGVDYKKVAYECTLPRGAGKDVNEINKASKRLEKPIERLEALRLADARLDAKTSRRNASYLRAIGCAVFHRWPLWPKEV